MVAGLVGKAGKKGAERLDVQALLGAEHLSQMVWSLGGGRMGWRVLWLVWQMGAVRSGPAQWVSGDVA